MWKDVMISIILAIFAIAIILTCRKVFIDGASYTKAVTVIGGERTVHEIKGYTEGFGTYTLKLANGDRIRIAKENCELLEVKE